MSRHHRHEQYFFDVDSKHSGNYLTRGKIMQRTPQECDRKLLIVAQRCRLASRSASLALGVACPAAVGSASTQCDRELGILSGCIGGESYSSLQPLRLPGRGHGATPAPAPVRKYAGGSLAKGSGHSPTNVPVGCTSGRRVSRFTRICRGGTFSEVH